MSFREIKVYGYKASEIYHTQVSFEDYDRLKQYNWVINKNGFVTNTYGFNSSSIQYMVVKVDKKLFSVKHIDGDKLNNIRENLIAVEKTLKTNKLNKKISIFNKSGKTGVSFQRSCSKWKAAITINKKYIHLGVYEDIETAIKIRELAESMYYKLDAKPEFNKEEFMDRANYIINPNKFDFIRRVSKANIKILKSPPTSIFITVPEQKVSEFNYKISVTIPPPIDDEKHHIKIIPKKLNNNDDEIYGKPETYLPLTYSPLIKESLSAPIEKVFTFCKEDLVRSQSY